MVTHLTLAKAFKRGLPMKQVARRYRVPLAYVHVAVRRYLYPLKNGRFDAL